jgi:hypothetical protein
MSGPQICEALRKAGFAMTEWRPAIMNTTLYECSYERAYGGNGEVSAGSVFLLVRGNDKGRISSMRAKLVNPVTAAGDLDPQTMTIFETLLEQPRWLEFREALAAIRQLKDVRQEGFGVRMVFSREFTTQGSYNFMLTLSATPGAQARTRAYFADEGQFSALRQGNQR